MFLSSATVDAYILFDGQMFCKYEPLWQEVSVESMVIM